MKKYVLGLDIGIASVGWGIIDLDSNEVLDKGVRIFTERNSEENLKRRTKRSSRRLLRRRNQRILDLKNLFVKENWLSENFTALDNQYLIREKGIALPLTKEELATALLHIAKRRGSFLLISREDLMEEIKTNNMEATIEDNEEKNKEASNIKETIIKNSKTLREKNYFVCQLQNEWLKDKNFIRSHDNIFGVDDYLREVKQLLQVSKIETELQNKIIEIIFRKREYYEGPGSIKSPTPFGRYRMEGNKLIIEDLIERMRGKCSVYPNELRAPKMSYSACLFNFLNDLNNLKVKGEKLTYETKKEIIENFINKKGEIKPKQLCTFLKVEEIDISGFRIDKEKKPLLTKFEGYQKIKKVIESLEDSSKSVLFETKEYVDIIIEILTRIKGVKERKKAIEEKFPAIVNEKTADALSIVSGISEYHSLSFKALEELNKDLLHTSYNQMQILANKKVIIKNKETKAFKITFNEKDFLNPVVKRAQNEAIKVVNALRKKYGEFDSIVIEMARDKNSEDEKKRIQKEQKKGELLNKRALEIAGKTPINAATKRKIRLYEEQDAKCAYSGKSIDLYKLIHDPLAYEIDHVIPFSISLDDSMQNKVVVESRENQQKSNRTPFQYFCSGQASQDFDSFQSFVLNLYKRNLISKKKLELMLFKEDINKYNVQKGFIERNLVDTRYATKSILNTLQSYFESNQISTKVHTIRGIITSIMRKKANLEKSRDTYYHHIVDAILVASVKKIKNFEQMYRIGILDSGERFDTLTGEVLDIVSEKQFFSGDLMKLITQLRKLNSKEDYSIDDNISHKVDRKPNRQFTDETIYGARLIDGTYKRMAKISDIYGEEGIKLAKDIKDGTDDKYFIKTVDPKTYEILKKIVLDTYKDTKENPFKLFYDVNGPIKKYSKKGNGPIVKQIKYVDKNVGNHVDITHKFSTKPNKDGKIILINVKPYRTDFYRNEEGLIKFVTVRRESISLKNKKYFIDQNWYEEEKKQKNIDSTYKFMFSLHKNEIFEVKDSNHSNFYRFVGTNVDDKNVIEMKPMERSKLPDNKRIKKSIGREIQDLVKYHVSVLGELYKVNNEVLQMDI